MKKILITVFIAALTLSMALSCIATTGAGGSEGDSHTDESSGAYIKEYVTEKIAPVAVGVATSLIAFIGAFGKIRASLSALNSSSDAIKELKETSSSTLKGIKAELDRGLTSVYETVKDVPEIKEGYCELISSYNQLKEQNAALLEAIKTGFEAIPQAVESGAARKIAILNNIVASEE